MSLRFQLSNARADLGIREVSGVCNDTDKFRYQVNAAIRQLMKRGGWFGTEVLARFCIYGCSITLPRHVGAIIGARNQCTGQMDVKNNWYEIMGTHFCDSVFNANQKLRDDGTAPCYNEVSGTTGKYIAYHVVKNEDIGKSITIYGTAYGGQPLQERYAGAWRNGITLTASAASDLVLPAATAVLVTKITSIVRQPTQGMTYLYEKDPAVAGYAGMRNLANYEPNETNPQYRRMKVEGYNGIPKQDDANGRRVATLDAMVSLEYHDLVNDNDFLLIDDFDAIRYAIQAYKNDNSENPKNAEVFWEKAIRELNYRDRKKSPGDQITVRVRTMGSNRMITNPT